jgi:hypothetical protein
MSNVGNSTLQHPAAASRIWLVRILLLLLAIGFLLQLNSPLRLNNDAIVLLSMGDSAAHNSGFLNRGQATVFPPGYPAILAFLLKTGFAHPWVIVGLNVIFLVIGLLAVHALLVRRLFQDRTVVLVICSIFLLSFVVIKHFTLPLTDVPFFCCSMCCLSLLGAAIHQGSSLRFFTLVLSAWLLALAAIAVRRVGLALLPALIFMLATSPLFRLMLKRASLASRLAFLAAALLACLATAQVVRKTSTLSDFNIATQRVKTSELVARVFSYRLTELGELFANFPSWKTPEKLRFVTPWIGLFALLLFLYGLLSKRAQIGPTEVFLVGYTAILFTWPYNDARFWLPVLPLLAAYCALAVQRLRLPAVLVATYCVVFAILGFGALGYSTRISFAGSKFPDKFGDGHLRSTYCAALQSCAVVPDPSDVDPKVLYLLEEYK